MKSRWISLIVLLALVPAGCGRGGSLVPGEPQVPPSMDEPAAHPENPSPTPAQPVEVTPLPLLQPDIPPQGDTSPMPNLSDPDLQKMIQTAAEDLAKRFSVSMDQIEFKETAEVVWPDSSLGCPNPSSMYTQVLTPGYLIRLQALGRIFEYHTNKNNLVVYCENPAPLPLDSLPDQ